MQVIEQLLFAGAVWFVPAATETVIVAVPAAFFVTVTVVPETATAATLVLLEVAVMAPSPGRVAVKVVVVAC